MLDWLFSNFIEFFAVLTGFIAIFFQIKANVIYWPISIVNVITYCIVFFQAKLYAEITLQLYYLVMSIYGWILWLRKSPTNEKLNISKSSIKLLLTLLLVFFPLWLIMAFLLKKYTNTDVPYIDSFITSLSYIATYLLARKKIENWLLWIFIDFISIGLYYYKGLYLTIILFLALTILAIVGYFKWKKHLYAS
jgi:nicotinamide mononucleotide transporter